jgi:hypothetical protein
MGAAGVTGPGARRRRGTRAARVVAGDPPGEGMRAMSVKVKVEYERENDRIIVARHEGKEIARIVQVEGGPVSFRMEDGSKRGGSVKDIDQAKKQIERFLK